MISFLVLMSKVDFCSNDEKRAIRQTSRPLFYSSAQESETKSMKVWPLHKIISFQDVEINSDHWPARLSFATDTLAEAEAEPEGEDHFIGTMLVTDQSTIDLNGGHRGRLRVITFKLIS